METTLEPRPSLGCGLCLFIVLIACVIFAYAYMSDLII